MSRRRNPMFFGTRVEDVLAKAGGAILTQFVNGQFVAPILGRFIPTQTGAIASVFDAASTFASARVTGMAVGLVDPRFRDDVEDGGTILAGAKILGAVVPGASLTATYPSFLNRFGFNQPKAVAPMAMGTGSTTSTVPLPAGAALGGQTSAYATLANSADDGGI